MKIDLLHEVAIREKACQEYDQFLITEIKEAANNSLTEKFLDQHGHNYCEGYRTALEYVAQIIDNFEISN